MSIAPRIGRWEVDSAGLATLLGSHCTACGETLFPERPVCSRCGSRAMEEVHLRGPATLTSYTVVHQVPHGFTAPLVVAYGQIQGDLMVLAPIDAAVGELRPGLQMELHEGVTSVDDDGTPFRTYRFRPARG
ncbi:MAG: Zn-ribbon domain-containing OB-fold protein [Acidimicrobiales bacterium]